MKYCSLSSFPRKRESSKKYLDTCFRRYDSLGYKFILLHVLSKYYG
jgi:hypothetical protein